MSDDQNPLSPNYRRREHHPGAVERAATGLFVGLFVAALSIAGLVLILSLLYGIVLLIFRHAFGVELPNPYNWLRTF